MDLVPKLDPNSPIIIGSRTNKINSEPKSDLLLIDGYLDLDPKQSALPP